MAHNILNNNSHSSSSSDAFLRFEEEGAHILASLSQHTRDTANAFFSHQPGRSLAPVPSNNVRASDAFNWSERREVEFLNSSLIPDSPLHSMGAKPPLVQSSRISDSLDFADAFRRAEGEVEDWEGSTSNSLAQSRGERIPLSMEQSFSPNIPPIFSRFIQKTPPAPALLASGREERNVVSSSLLPVSTTIEQPFNNPLSSISREKEIHPFFIISQNSSLAISDKGEKSADFRPPLIISPKLPEHQVTSNKQRSFIPNLSLPASQTPILRQRIVPLATTSRLTNSCSSVEKIQKKDPPISNRADETRLQAASTNEERRANSRPILIISPSLLQKESTGSRQGSFVPNLSLPASQTLKERPLSSEEAEKEKEAEMNLKKSLNDLAIERLTKKRKETKKKPKTPQQKGLNDLAMERLAKKRRRNATREHTILNSISNKTESQASNEVNSTKRIDIELLLNTRS